MVEWTQQGADLVFTHTYTTLSPHREAATARRARVKALRGQVAAKQAELGELDAWYNQLLDGFEDRCRVR